MVKSTLVLLIHLCLLFFWVIVFLSRLCCGRNKIRKPQGHILTTILLIAIISLSTVDSSDYCWRFYVYQTGESGMSLSGQADCNPQGCSARVSILVPDFNCTLQSWDLMNIFTKHWPLI